MYEVVCAYRSIELCYFKNIKSFLHGNTSRKMNLNVSGLSGLC